MLLLCCRTLENSKSKVDSFGLHSRMSKSVCMSETFPLSFKQFNCIAACRKLKWLFWEVPGGEVLDICEMFDKENACRSRAFTSALASLRAGCGIRTNSWATCPRNKIGNPEAICWEFCFVCFSSPFSCLRNCVRFPTEVNSGIVLSCWQSRE